MADGLDGLWGEAVPGFRASVEQRRFVIEGPVGQKVRFQIGPQVLDRVEFGRVGRQKQQAQARRHYEVLRAMPSRVVQHQNDVAAGRDLGGQFGQKPAHGLGVDPRQQQRARLARARIGRAKQVEVLVAGLADDDRPRAAPRPDGCQRAFLAKARFVLKPDFNGFGGVGFARLLDKRGASFSSHCAIFSGSFSSWRGRGRSSS